MKTGRVTMTHLKTLRRRAADAKAAQELCYVHPDTLVRLLAEIAGVRALVSANSDRPGHWSRNLGVMARGLPAQRTWPKPPCAACVTGLRSGHDAGCAAKERRRRERRVPKGVTAPPARSSPGGALWPHLTEDAIRGPAGLPASPSLLRVPETTEPAAAKRGPRSPHETQKPHKLQPGAATAPLPRGTPSLILRDAMLPDGMSILIALATSTKPGRATPRNPNAESTSAKRTGRVAKRSTGKPRTR